MDTSYILKFSRICSLHFHAHDFDENHLDMNSKRRKIHNSGQLEKRYLKENAVPPVFHHAPKYLSHPCTTPRPTSRATSTQRIAHKAMELDQLKQCSQETNSSVVQVLRDTVGGQASPTPTCTGDAQGRSGTYPRNGSGERTASGTARSVSEPDKYGKHKMGEDKEPGQPRNGKD